MVFYFFFSSRRRHTISKRDWSSDVCSSDLFSSRDASSLVFLVLPLAILDASLDVNLVALLAIFLDDVGETGALGVPHHAAVPFGLLLLLTIWRIPLPARRERERRDPIATGRRPHLGIAAQVPDQHHFVQTSAHCASWREFMSRPE